MVGVGMYGYGYCVELRCDGWVDQFVLEDVMVGISQGIWRCGLICCVERVRMW